jgi:hypothetical protein
MTTGKILWDSEGHIIGIKADGAIVFRGDFNESTHIAQAEYKLCDCCNEMSLDRIYHSHVPIDLSDAEISNGLAILRAIANVKDSISSAPMWARN